MKKLLLASVAVSGLAFAAAPAHANIELELGGYFRGYGAFVSQDDDAAEINEFDIIRDTELHFGGETTLDNGLTVGFHTEFDVDTNESASADESYLYFSGDWGRVNFGAEDGAAYLLQVAAPSADSNFDGIRQYVNPVRFGSMNAALAGRRLDYDHAPTVAADKFTYLSPIFSGFQAGVSFSPDSDAADATAVGLDDTGTEGTAETYEAAVRYEGQFQNVGVIAGAGYSQGEEDSFTNTKDREIWNVGLDLDIGPFGIGGAYKNDNNSVDDADTDTWVLGVDYTTGPFKLGASYLNEDTEGSSGVEYDRYTGGVTYEYGPGMSFRGSLSYVEADLNAGTEYDGTSVILGTQVNF